MNDQMLETIRRAERALERDCATVTRLCAPRVPAIDRLEAQLGRAQAQRLVGALSGGGRSLRMAA